MKNVYTIYPDLVLRTPFLSYLDYDVAINKKTLTNAYLHLAIYLASPAFYELLSSGGFEPSNLDPKVLLSLAKYYNRMSFRATPFGGFSSCTVIRWTTDEQLVLDSRENSIMKLKLDNELVTQAVTAARAKIRHDITYVVNPTLYQLNKHFRYIKSSEHTRDGKISYSMESFECDTLTRRLLKYVKQKPIRQADILGWIGSRTGYNEEESLDYLNLLETAQILKTDWTLNITGQDYLDRIANLKALPKNSLPAKLQTYNKALQVAGYPQTAMLKDLSARINVLMEQQNLRQPRGNFYANTFRPLLSGGLHMKYQDKILNTVDALRQLVPPAQPQTMRHFVKNFKERFDKQRIRLLEALDPDAGVGYGNLTTMFQEPFLLENIQFPDSAIQTQSIEWTAAHRFLLQKWNEMNANSLPFLAIDVSELKMPEQKNDLALPPSICVMFRLAGEHLILESAGGASGTSIIGRFTALDPTFLGIGQDLAKMEESNNPDLLFAEIALVSDAHVDNINRRAAVYSYEIPINAHSGYPLDKQIHLTDLFISVVEDQIVLESASLKKVIIPRLSSAYNFNNNDLAIFRFLCDLQYQGLHANLTFDLENFFPGMAHYPRVTLNGVTIAEAKWHPGEELTKISNLNPENAIAEFSKIKHRLRLPDLICVSKSDQQLVFDLANKDELLFFFAAIKDLKKPLLKEYILPDATSAKVRDGAGQPYTNEMITFLYRQTPAYLNRHVPAVPVKAATKRAFLLGSSWLYLKIYCTAASSNELLTGQLLPLIRKFPKTEPVTWFFVRYIDSGYHIRFRVKIEEPGIGPLITQFKDRLSDVFRYQIIKEYQADTYQRELERYGTDLIEDVENFFYQSSNLLLRFIAAGGADLYGEYTIAMATVIEMLEIFIPEPDGQLNFLSQMRDSFLMEFMADKPLRLGLDSKYRNLRKEMESLPPETNLYRRLRLKAHKSEFDRSVKNLAAAVINEDKHRRNQLLGDLIHMHLNRAFASHQRKQELVVYHCIYKLKVSARARNKRPAQPDLAAEKQYV
ncbi:lantibiotic dehydratase [Mucilaginibacter endophyticus]|uniref:lantibiotic dehydratase n=1 Tax=Mucilaginibacter endophyticus TaxID=2675003 RepID=UPI00137A3461|nr:lantibiotic dehydratase [Mucilaginibacter endophyticus]